MFDEYITEFFKKLDISLKENPQQPGAEQLKALLAAFDALVSRKENLQTAKDYSPLDPEEIDSLRDCLQNFSLAASDVIHGEEDQKIDFSPMVADFMPVLKLQQNAAFDYVENIRRSRLKENAVFNVNSIFSYSIWVNRLDSLFDACAEIVKKSTLISRDTGQHDMKAREAMRQMEAYLKASPYYLEKRMQDAKKEIRRNVTDAESAIEYKMQKSGEEAAPGLFDQLGFLIPFGLQPSKISLLYHRKIGSSEAFRKSQRAAAKAVVEEYLNTGRVRDTHGYVGLPLHETDPKKYVQDALKTIAVCDYINREKAAAAEYRNITTYPEKIKSGVSRYLDAFFSSEKPGDYEKAAFDEAIGKLVKYSPAASFIYEDPATLKQRLGESTPEEKLAQLSGGTLPNILNAADSDALIAMSELSSSQRMGNSDSYNAVGDAMLRLADAAHRPGGIVAEDYAVLYKTLQKYVYTHDSQPFTKSGQKRFDAAAKLMVDVGLHLAELDPDMRKTIDRDIRVNALRSKTFREYYKEKVDNLAVGSAAGGSSFVPRARQLARVIDVHLAEYNKKLDPTGKKPPVEMITGKMPDFQKQQELLEKADFTGVPAGKSIPGHIFTDISGMKNRTTSHGQMSQRLPITVELEDGKVLQGYFTENSEARFKERYNAVLADLCSRGAPEQKAFYSALREVKMETAVTVLRTLVKQEGVSDGAGLVKRRFAANFESWLQAMERAGCKKVADAGRALPFKQVGDALKNSGHNRENLGDPVLQETYDMFSGYVENVWGIYASAKMNLEFAKVEQGGNLNLRNNALYDVAKLLNHPDLICKTVQMSVTDNKVQKQGTFMVNAKGVQAYKVMDGVNIGGRTAPIRILPACKRDMSRIEVLDYLCGNIDRHNGNFFMDARFVPDANGGHVDICGLQGIDNDMSFGALSGKENVSRMSSVNNIWIMDKDQADEIQNMKPEDFEGIMRGIGLSKEEIEAGLNRLSALKHRINTYQIEVVDGLAAWDRVKIKDYALDEMSIWTIVKRIEASGDKKLNKGSLEEQDAFTPETFRAVTEPKKMETFEVRNCDAQVQIKEQVFYLEKLRDRFAATGAVAASPEYNNMRSGMDIFINYASKLSDAERVDDRELNRLADGFAELNRRAKVYIKKGLESAKTAGAKAAAKDRMNLAKNLAVLAANGQHAIQEEILDAANRAFVGGKVLFEPNPESNPKSKTETKMAHKTELKTKTAEEASSETKSPIINGPH